MKVISTLATNAVLSVVVALGAIGISSHAHAQDGPSAKPASQAGPAPAIPPTGGGLSPTSFDSAETLFNRFDAGRTGYLTKDQVQSLDGFSFEAADLNRDGRLSAAEFDRAWSDYQSKK